MSPSSKPNDGTLPTPHSMRAPKSVYRFTDMKGLLGIIEHAELRATEASGLNDPTEVSGGLQRIYSWVDEHSGLSSVQKILEVAPEPAELFGRIYVLSACVDVGARGQGTVPVDLPADGRWIARCR